MRRESLLVTALWLSVIGQSTWVGGTLYQMVVIVPIWSSSPPESVRAFFLGTSYNETIWNFFGPPFMAARILPVFAALVLAWPFRSYRVPLLIAAAGLGIAIAFTLIYVYPINAVLFQQAGGSSSGEEVRSMVTAWILADRARFALGLVVFAAILHAFRLPLEETRRE